MTPASFCYRRATSVADAIGHLVEHGDDAKLLAGGHSLLPIMKLRLATPAVLIDIGDLSELDYVRAEGEEIAIGALTRHADLEKSELLAEAVPLLRHVAGAVGDPQVRHRGTVGGSVAHGEPAADLPAALVALGATVVVDGPGGRRGISVDDLYLGFLETSLRPDELVVEVRIPRTDSRRWGFQKFRRRSIDWAIVGVAFQDLDSGGGIGLINMSDRTLRARRSEEALQSGAAHEEVARLADDETNPPDDGAATSVYRRHLARVLLGRALAGLADS